MGFLQNAVIAVFIFLNTFVSGALGIFHLAQQSEPRNQTTATTTQAIGSNGQSTATTTATEYTFKWVPISNLPSLYSQKDERIYITGNLFSSIDPQTLLAAVGPTGRPIQYAKDKSHVYYFSLGWDGSTDPESVSAFDPKIISDAPDTFTPLFGTPVADLSKQEIANIIGPENNWQCLYDAYGKDANHVYFQDNVITGADPKTFSIIFDSNGCPTNYDTDRSNIYYDGDTEGTTIVLPSSIDRSSFKVLNDLYIEDKNGVYNQYGFPVSDSTTTFSLVTPARSCGTGCIYDAENGSQKFFAGFKLASTTLNTTY